MSKNPSDSYHFQDQIGHILRRAYQRHSAIFQQFIADSNLTAAQFITLCTIRDLDACSLADIVKVTAVDQATIRGIIERLKSRKLISIEQDKEDKRKVLVTLTAAGKTLVKQTTPQAVEITEATYGNLNEAERLALLFLLKKMLMNDVTES